MSATPEDGYLYVVSGARRYLEEAARSAASLRRVDPQAHITLVVSPECLQAGAASAAVFDRVEVRGEAETDAGHPLAGLLFKVRHLFAASPYRRTFFVDTDTYFVDSCRCLFALLQYTDLCLAHAVADLTTATVGGRELVGCTPYNTGVLLFQRNPTVAALCARWSELFQARRDRDPHDQPALLQALLEVPCRLYVLQNTWNARFPFFERFTGPVRLLHGRHADLPHIARRINQTTANRVWLPALEVCVARPIGWRGRLRLLVGVAHGLWLAASTRRRRVA
jgi:hypothetical protein